MTHQDDRTDQLEQWLTEYIKTPYRLTTASEDASFRRYYRVEKDDRSWIVMDAPPDKEDMQAFVNIAKQLKNLSLHVPQIYQYDLQQGFALLSDLGCTQYLSILKPENADRLYQDALSALFTIQSQAADLRLPDYDSVFLRQELNIFTDWFINTHLQLNLDQNAQSVINHCFDYLLENASQQPYVFVHRDFHSRNLMYCDDHNPGILDFQGALSGPITYDLVSLLRDCYLAWPDTKIDQWLTHYYHRLIKHNMVEADFDTFRRWFDLMGLQRHLKVLGIFSRLNYRDQKPHYLQDIPRVLNYIMQVAQRYDELRPFYDQINKFNIE